VLTPEDSSIPLRMDVGMPMLYANAGGKGYYRTAYTADQYKAIVAKAESALTPPERIGLLGDRWALVRSGQGTVGQYLDLVLALKEDPNAAVLDTVHQQLKKINSDIATDEDRSEFAAVVRRQFGPVYRAMGSPVKGEPFDRQQLRGTLFEMLGAARDPAVLAEAQQLTARALAVDSKKDKTLDATLSDAAVLVSSSNGDAALYDKVLAVSRDSGDPGEKTDALRTLAGFHDPALVERTLDYVVSGEVRNQDSWIVLSALLRDRETRDQTWTYMEKNWNRVHAQLTVSSGAEVVRAVGSFCTVQQRDEVIDFFATHKIEATERTLAKAIDSINDCIQLRSNQEVDFHRWLEAQPR
jgi:aminopeptidase N/puromycin-sensitive aminopeptidase